MFDITWTHPVLPIILNAIPIGMKSLIDLGCSKGIIGALCRIYRKPTRLLGLDIYEPYLEFCKRFNFYDEYLHWNLKEFPLPFKTKEFDVATCIEVLEHLPKKSGANLIRELDRIAKYIIISTPNMLYEQSEFDQNPHQQHISLWSGKDFRNLGYKVQGIGGMKVFGREVRYLSTALGPYTKYIPSLSSMLLCIKDNKSIKETR